MNNYDHFTILKVLRFSFKVHTKILYSSDILKFCCCRTFWSKIYSESLQHSSSERNSRVNSEECKCGSAKLNYYYLKMF